MATSSSSVPPRDYSCKDAKMLIGGATIVDAAIAHKEILQKKRSNWTDDFFNTLKERIDKAAKNYLDADSAKALRQATKNLKDLITPVQTALSELKSQIEEDFDEDKDRRDEILKTLGYTDFYKGAKKSSSDQEALSSLLSRFSQNMSKDLRQQIIEKGTAADTIDSILAAAKPVMDANIAQEGQKGKRPEATKEAVTEFNAIYKEVSSVAKLSAKFLKDDKAAKDQFSFPRPSAPSAARLRRLKRQPNQQKKTATPPPLSAVAIHLSAASQFEYAHPIFVIPEGNLIEAASKDSLRE